MKKERDKAAKEYANDILAGIVKELDPEGKFEWDLSYSSEKIEEYFKAGADWAMKYFHDAIKVMASNNYIP